MSDRKIKLPKQLELANYLGVSVQCVRQYPKKKRYLMLLGIKFLNELRLKNGEKAPNQL